MEEEYHYLAKISKEKPTYKLVGACLGHNNGSMGIFHKAAIVFKILRNVMGLESINVNHL